LAITIFSFVGIPPLIGFFAKQMVLSAALDNGYIFICLVAILTSVIGAVYYLNLIKEIFFFKGYVYVFGIYKKYSKSTTSFGPLNKSEGELISISSPFSITITIITLAILLFIFMNKE
jgi:NADH-ubiquinone oxidoreductase chain 2